MSNHWNYRIFGLPLAAAADAFDRGLHGFASRGFVMKPFEGQFHVGSADGMEDLRLPTEQEVLGHVVINGGSVTLWNDSLEADVSFASSKSWRFPAISDANEHEVSASLARSVLFHGNHRVELAGLLE